MFDLQIKDTIIKNFKRITVIQHTDKQELLYINEVFTEDNKIKERWIQDWNCNDVTEKIQKSDKNKIYNLLEAFYYSKSK